MATLITHFLELNYSQLALKWLCYLYFVGNVSSFLISGNFLTFRAKICQSLDTEFPSIPTQPQGCLFFRHPPS